MALKVLFVSKGGSPDYLNDCLYHGLKCLRDEIEVSTTADMWFMYDDMDSNTRSSLYGKGFTIYGKLPAGIKSEVLKYLAILELRRKIKDRYFDLIIYGSIWRCASHLQFITKFYPPNRIFLIDGEDHQRTSPNYGLGIYFKRENNTSMIEPVFPISFGVPEELVLSAVGSKEKYWATVIPGNLATYVFESEEEYFADYQNSRYGITTKKGGWDCLRHYEIMMNGCVPYFPFINECPQKTMANMPKQEFFDCYTLINRNSMSDTLYQEKAEFFLEHTRSHLTTKSLARYVLGHFDDKL